MAHARLIGGDSRHFLARPHQTGRGSVTAVLSNESTIMKTPNPIRKVSALLLAAMLAAPVCVFAADVDDRIENSFKDSYSYRSHLRDVSVDAENGVVTLKGKVDNIDQKQLAEDTVRGLPGVTSVNNKITVKSEPKESSDDWIALKVRSSLLYHRNVSLADIDVKVLNSVVTLTGTAENDAAKALAAEYAADIKGVAKVDNQLTIATEAEAKLARERRELNNERREMKNDMNNERRDLKNDTRDAKNEIKADARDAKNEIKSDTREARDRTAGAWDRNVDKIDDASITAQVKGSLAAHRSTSAIRTEVSTTDGVVTLRGEAKNSAEKDLATKVTKDIRGVRSVRNDMVVNRE